MFLIAYTFKGQVHVFAGRVKLVSHSSCRTSAILKYFVPWNAYIKFGEILSFCSQDIERKRNFGINQGP